MSSEVGSIYVIVNPAWPDMVKVGMAKNVVKRLQAYQTYCPDGGYTIAHAWAVPLADVARAERYAHRALKDYHHRAEWFKVEQDAAVLLVGSILEQRFNCGVSMDEMLEQHEVAKNAEKKQQYYADHERQKDQRREQQAKRWRDPYMRDRLMAENRERMKKRYHGDGLPEDEAKAKHEEQKERARLRQQKRRAKLKAEKEATK